MTDIKPPSGNNENCPSCFGTLDIVFPRDENGLRSTPEPCFACEHKTCCLRSAMESPDGWKVREEFADRSYRSGMINFLQRWAKKKDIQRKLQEERRRS
ncbi:MAG: hypothetical protein Q8P24_04015 [Desulfobacterales bacterium]|nr:hypothetical protein [Desulfobacterales bacterium]